MSAACFQRSPNWRSVVISASVSLIVPASNVFDAVVATALRLRSSEVHVGESTTLSADEQARLLGDAWERAEQPGRRSTSGSSSTTTAAGADTYHLGAHPRPSPPAISISFTASGSTPSRPSGRTSIITTSFGPHSRKWNNNSTDPNATTRSRRIRDDGPTGGRTRRGRPRRATIARLRDMVRNRHAGESRALLTELSLEDQVVVFRVLPRKDAAAVFEYLSHEAQETLLKAMAQEDVAALLNNMAPDDRTMFLEELPAAATRQLLTLLTPEERAVARHAARLSREDPSAG